MAKDKRIVITGIGPITSIGIGKEALWGSLLEGRTNIKLEESRIDGELWDKYYFHKVDGFDITKFGINKELLDWVKDWKEGDEIVDLYYMIAAIKLALDDSGLDYKPYEENDFGLVLTHENMGLIPFLSKVSDRAFNILKDKSKDLSKKEFYDKLYKDCIRSGYDVQPFMTLFHIAKVFNVRQHSLFICNACASGLYGIETASEMIKNGQNSTVIVAASDYPDIYKYIWFRDLGIYSKDGVMKPFSKDSKGLAFGDGGIAIVVEELEHAKKRNAPIYAEYLGGGFSLEGWQVTVPKVGSDSYQRAISKAFKQSGVDKKEIDLLCPHGIGSHVIDYYESKAITDTFGVKSNKPLITAFKPYVGHNLGGSALLETAILLLSLKNETIIPTLNSDNTNPAYNISLVREKIDKKLKMVMKICAAFAGYNAAAIFRRLD
ncbi:MAG: beta-ketoacyl synthase N-terminal-like domain-containing protein [Candidatus Omnitrophota bacterium]|nr:beta-ketoacyl synthase N-terminal-like domain-containing protein [Candidatus Omnitrophota bacterium]